MLCYPSNQKIQILSRGVFAGCHQHLEYRWHDDIHVPSPYVWIGGMGPRSIWAPQAKSSSLWKNWWFFCNMLKHMFKKRQLFDNHTETVENKTQLSSFRWEKARNISWDEQPPLLTKALPCNLRERPRRKRPRLPAGAPAPTGGQLNGDDFMTIYWNCHFKRLPLTFEVRLGFPYERDCCLEVPKESQTTNPNRQFSMSWNMLPIKK